MAYAAFRRRASGLGAGIGDICSVHGFGLGRG